jgi:periplasmic protein TonB
MHAPSSSHDLRPRASTSRPAPHLVKASEDPLARVIGLGTDKRFLGATVALFLALCLHGSAAARMALINVDLLAWTHNLRFMIDERLASTYDIEVEKPKPAEPEPEAKEEPKEEKAAPKEAAPKEAAPPPPAAAQAGAVLTQQPDDAPVDFTNSFVVGNAETYAGGVTQANGTSASAVRNLGARAEGVAGGTGTKPAPAVVGTDRSRTLALTSKDWHCDFPPEADSEQIDQMVVPIEVNVSASGRVTNARAIKDPGYGFGRAAVQCALRQGGGAFDVALDRDGNPIAGQRTFNVHFDR